MKHSETEGDHQDQEGRSDEQNKQTVEQRGMVGAKSGADDQSVPPAGREGEASQNEQQTGQSAQIIDNSTMEHSGTVSQRKQPVPMGGMVSQGQQGETSGADDLASQNKQQTEQSGEASQRKQSAQLHVSPQSSADDVQILNDSTKLDQSDSLASLEPRLHVPNQFKLNRIKSCLHARA